MIFIWKIDDFHYKSFGQRCSEFENVVADVDKVQETHSRLEVPLGMRYLWVAPSVSRVDVTAFLKGPFQLKIHKGDHCSFSRLEFLFVVCEVVELISKGVDQRKEFGTDGVCLRIQDERRLNVCFLPEERIKKLHGG